MAHFKLKMANAYLSTKSMKNGTLNIIDQKNQLMVDLEKKCSLFLENYFNTLMTSKN